MFSYKWIHFVFKIEKLQKLTLKINTKHCKQIKVNILNSYFHYIRKLVNKYTFTDKGGYLKNQVTAETSFYFWRHS